MSLTPPDADDLAYDFVTEYLERNPEYIDVAEFVSDNDPDDLLPDEEDAFIQAVYRLVLVYMNEAARKF